MNGNITPEMLKMMNLPNEAIQSLIANMPAKKQEPMTAYQTAQIALDQKKYELQLSQNGKLTPAQQKDYDLAVEKLNFEKKKYNTENGITESVDTSKTIQYANSKEV